MKQESPMNKRPKTSSNTQKILVLSLAGLAVFFGTLLSGEQISAGWWNFLGAACVAVGGLLGSLSTYGVVPHETRPASWAFLVAGGFAIAGASLQMVLWPS